MGIRPSITQEKYIAKRNYGGFAHTMNNTDFADHFAGTETFYFFGTGRIKDVYTHGQRA